MNVRLLLDRDTIVLYRENNLRDRKGTRLEVFLHELRSRNFFAAEELEL